MCRLGIGLYGFSTTAGEELEPISTLRTRIVQIRTLHKGDTVGYGRNGKVEKESRIATIPVGYADGYPRLLSGKGRVIVRGQYAPIVGRICMDQFMIDVTDIDGVREEDTVTLIGRDGGCYISADEVASHAMTINYEIICGISKRVPKVYIQDK